MQKADNQQTWMHWKYENEVACELWVSLWWNHPAQTTVSVIRHKSFSTAARAHRGALQAGALGTPCAWSRPGNEPERGQPGQPPPGGQPGLPGLPGLPLVVCAGRPGLTLSHLGSGPPRQPWQPGETQAESRYWRELTQAARSNMSADWLH